MVAISPPDFNPAAPRRIVGSDHKHRCPFDYLLTFKSVHFLRRCCSIPDRIVVVVWHEGWNTHPSLPGPSQLIVELLHRLRFLTLMADNALFENKNIPWDVDGFREFCKRKLYVCQRPADIRCLHLSVRLQ